MPEQRTRAFSDMLGIRPTMIRSTSSGAGVGTTLQRITQNRVSSEGGGSGAGLRVVTADGTDNAASLFVPFTLRDTGLWLITVHFTASATIAAGTDAGYAGLALDIARADGGVYGGSTTVVTPPTVAADVRTTWSYDACSLYWGQGGSSSDYLEDLEAVGLLVENDVPLGDPYLTIDVAAARLSELPRLA